VATNSDRAFAEGPEVAAAWVQLNTSIEAGMDLRGYELATLAAARRLRSSYCCLAHGKILRDRFDEPVREIALDHRESFRELEPELREALVVGRPIAEE
jgi:alkylhydroperoxidase family enzyme